jgi:Ca2+-transporting ATPase
VSCNTIGTAEESAATEKAMLKFIKRCGVDYHYLRQKYLPKDMMRFMFDSARKRMSTICDLEDEEAMKTEHGYNRRLHIKGASEIVLETCDSYLTAQG